MQKKTKSLLSLTAVIVLVVLICAAFVAQSVASQTVITSNGYDWTQAVIGANSAIIPIQTVSDPKTVVETTDAFVSSHHVHLTSAQFDGTEHLHFSVNRTPNVIVLTYTK